MPGFSGGRAGFLGMRIAGGGGDGKRIKVYQRVGWYGGGRGGDRGELGRNRLLRRRMGDEPRFAAEGAPEGLAGTGAQE